MPRTHRYNTKYRAKREREMDYYNQETDWDQIYRILKIDGEELNRKMEEEKRWIKEESDQLRSKREEGFARLHEWETPQPRRDRNTRWYNNQPTWRNEEKRNYHYQRWEDERSRKEAIERELRDNKMRQNEELFYSRAAQQEEEEMRRHNERREEERKRREAFEGELRNAKKSKNEQRQIGEDLRKNGKNTNDKIEDNHNQKESMEPPQENMTKEVPEQDVNNDVKEEEVLIADPETETITSKDQNELYESPSEHCEVTNENIKTPYQEENKDNDTTGENDEAVQGMVSDNAPTVNVEYTNINSKTENKEVMASDTIKNQPKEIASTELLSFQKIMMECREKQFPHPVENSFEKVREEMMNDIRLWREEIIQQWREEMETNSETLEELQPEDTDKRTENKGDSKAVVPEDTHHGKEENIQRKETIIKGVKNKIIKKTEEKGTKIKGIILPRKTRVTKEILEMTRSGLINFVDNPIIRRKARLNGKKYKQNFVKILKINRHKTVSENFNKNTVKLKIPTNKIHHTRSIDSPMNNRPLNYLNNNPDDGTITTRLHTNDDVMTKKFINKEGLKGNTPRRKVLRKKEEDDQEQLDLLKMCIRDR